MGKKGNLQQSRTGHNQSKDSTRRKLQLMAGEEEVMPWNCSSVQNFCPEPMASVVDLRCTRKEAVITWLS